MTDDLSRTCRTCKESKPLSEFWPTSFNGKKYVRRDCKSCHRAVSLAGLRKKMADPKQAHKLKKRAAKLHRQKMKNPVYRAMRKAQSAAWRLRQKESRNIA